MMRVASVHRRRAGAVLATAAMIVGAQPAGALVLNLTATPTLDGSGRGVIDFSGALGLNAGETATFSAFTATYAFLAPDLAVKTGTSVQYVGQTMENTGSIYPERVDNYNVFNLYNPVQSTVTVSSLGETADGASPIRFEQRYLYELRTLLGTDGRVQLIRSSKYYDNLYHTDGPFSASIAYDAPALRSLGTAQALDFTAALSNAGIRLTGVTIDASYTVNAAAVPEPATWAVFIGGIGMAGTMLRRRRRIVVRPARCAPVETG